MGFTKILLLSVAVNLRNQCISKIFNDQTAQDFVKL